MRRVQKQQILKDLKKKMVFIVGPRQVGKTYLAKEIMKGYKNPVYLNYDSPIDRKFILECSWAENIDLLVLDELHKMPKWKNFLKGLYDTKRENLHLLVTGSARLDTYRRAGDSMAGRFFVQHLMPFSLKELQGTAFENDLLKLTERSGFPQPFLAEDEEQVKLWRTNYVDSLMRDDVVDFGNIEKFKAMKDIFEILRTKVGSNVSYQNIASDLSLSPTTVKKYVDLLETLYIVFLVRPHSKKISNSLKKEPKVYFYDTGLVVGDEGVIFENIIANALLKHTLGRRDFKGDTRTLFYLRDKQMREVDFVLADEYRDIELLIEVKLSDDKVSKSLKYFSEQYNLPGVQVVRNTRYGYKESDKINVREAKEFLNSLFL